jgi:SAM-dependent methyltransferase
MAPATESVRSTGSAERWGPLWGARPADWALSEDRQTPTYEAALQRVDVRPGQLVLDIGCGVGAFLRLIAERGALPYGLDASEALLELARARLAGADLRAGDMESLPYEDDTFDLVTGFNSFFFANDIVAALREAGRVAKPGAPVVIQVWGPHAHNDLEAMKEIARPFMPPRPADAPPEPDYSRPGVLEQLASQAGLTPDTAFDTVWAFEFPDEATMRRALVAPAGLAVLVGAEREEQFKDALSAGLARYRDPGGGYRLQNGFHFLIARAYGRPGPTRPSRDRAPRSGALHRFHACSHTVCVSRSSWVGLNCTNSLLGSFCTGMWPGGR